MEEPRPCLKPPRVPACGSEDPQGLVTGPAGCQVTPSSTYRTLQAVPPSGNRGREPRLPAPSPGSRGFLRASWTAGLIAAKHSPDLKSPGQVVVPEAQRGARNLPGELHPVVGVAGVHGREGTTERVTTPLGPSASPSVKWTGRSRSGVSSIRHASRRSGAPGGHRSRVSDLSCWCCVSQPQPSCPAGAFSGCLLLSPKSFQATHRPCRAGEDLQLDTSCGLREL